MSEMNDDIAQVHNKAKQPTGLLPKHIQGWLGCGLAVVLIIIFLIAPSRTPAKQTRTAQPPVTTPAEVERNVHSLEEQIRQEQKRIEEEKAAMERSKKAAQVTTETQPLRSTPRDSAAYSPSVDRRDSLGDDLKREELKRDYQSRFASVVALSFRREKEAREQQNALSSRSEAFDQENAASPVRPSGPEALEAPRVEAARRSTSGEKAADPYADLNHSVGPLHRIFEGKWLETVLTNQLDGTFSGPVNCMVTTPIYSQDGQHELIPRGSRVIGEAQHVDNFGQKRLAVVFHRIIMPDGYSVSLDRFKGLNQIGETGLRDKVNNHYLQLFGVSIAIGAIGGFSQICIAPDGVDRWDGVSKIH